jgi:hypothetical protein
VRHRKGEPVADYVTADVAAELRYRGLPDAGITATDPGPRVTDPRALEFRRYRMNEDMSKSRAGLELRLEFAKPVDGPLLLGQLTSVSGSSCPTRTYPEHALVLRAGRR